MQEFLQFFVLLPLLGFIISTLLPRKREKIIAQVALSTIGLHFAGSFVFGMYWVLQGTPTLDIKHITVFQTHDIEIFIDFFFDKTTAAFSVVGSLIILLVAIFSRTYMHREEGFKRYFCTVLLFFLGYNLIIFSGNFETMFAGWELVGISSFLLITFYRDRYLPVKNGIKVISIYRLGDICLILAMWMSHQLWHENITFIKLLDLDLVNAHVLEHNWYASFICLMIVIAAATKSAQLPFSSWLPRAMEGPTTSSAIFYGSLSVHLGVFVLLRTYPYWESMLVVKVCVISIGVLTALIANSIASVQSTVKTQIAYASATQLGLMFVEVALGFHILALVHFAGNAFLRTYQLLVSPSVLSYKVHNMYFHPVAEPETGGNTFCAKMKNTIFMLSVKEWNLDTLLYRLLWNPFKLIGKQLAFLTHRVALVFLAVLYILGLYIDIYPEQFPSLLFDFIPFLFSFIALLLVLRAFTERGDAIHAWLLVVTSQLFIALSILLFHEDFGHNYMLIYLSGSAICAIAGYSCLREVRMIDNDIHLTRFHSYVQEKPTLAFIFLLSCMGLVGLPFTPTFIGIDLLFSHIHKQEELLIILTALSFVFIELSVIRIYARIFLGQHKKMNHPIAYRSS